MLFYNSENIVPSSQPDWTQCCILIFHGGEYLPLVNRTTMSRPFLTVSDALSPVIDRTVFCLFDTQLNLNYFMGDWILSNGYIRFTVWPWQRITDWAAISPFWRTETLQQGMARLLVSEVYENLSSHLSSLLVFLSSIFGVPFFCLIPTFSFSWCCVCVCAHACLCTHPCIPFI